MNGGEGIEMRLSRSVYVLGDWSLVRREYIFFVCFYGIYDIRDEIFLILNVEDMGWFGYGLEVLLIVFWWMRKECGVIEKLSIGI